jgi:AGZA family xanthine/uracil permease-like MFS transporter
MIQRFLERSFEIKEKGSSIGLEIFCGILHFVSSLYILPVIPIQLEAAGYHKSKSIQITALGSGIGCIASSYITNLPFVVAPMSSVAIYIAVALQENGMDQSQGDAAVILSGFALLFIGICTPVISFATKLIPDCIQASTAIGIGLITALAGATELKLVVPGEYSILQMGDMTIEIAVAFIATVIIAVALYHKLKGSYTMGLLFGTITWWLISDQWPRALLSVPHFQVNAALALDGKVLVLLCNLVFLYALTLSGIARTLSDAAHLTHSDGSVPRINWLFIMCGVSTILSGYFSGPPILISPESAPGIKSGARTGLSMLVCGVLYSISVLFCPLLEHVPPAGTSPLLILVGLTLFVNSSRIQWTAPDEAVPAFFVLLLIPFTYSILTGVGIGYAFYIVIGLFTGQLQRKFHRAFLTFPDELPISTTSAHYFSFGEPDSDLSLGEEAFCSCEDEPRSPPEPPRPDHHRRAAPSMDARNSVRVFLPVVPSTRTQKRSVSFSDMLSADIGSGRI